MERKGGEREKREGDIREKGEKRGRNEDGQVWGGGEDGKKRGRRRGGVGRLEKGRIWGEGEK